MIRRPKNKFVRVTHDDFYSSDIHQLTSAPARSQQACAYDMDDVDLSWLNRVNAQRNAIGSSKISELSFEQTMEELERQSWANMQTLLKTEEVLGIEFDENVICDVCRAVSFRNSSYLALFFIPLSWFLVSLQFQSSFLVGILKLTSSQSDY